MRYVVKESVMEKLREDEERKCSSEDDNSYDKK